MKKIIVLFISLLITSCQSENTKTTASEFKSLLEDYYQENLKLYRIKGTFQGDTRYNDTLPNFLSPEFQTKEKAFYAYYLNALDRFDDSSLNEEDQLSKNILKWECETALKGMEFPKDQMPIDQMWGFQLTMGQLASGQGAQPFKTVQDYKNWLVRISGYIEWLDSAQDKMKEGMQSGWVLPKSLVVKVLPQLELMTTTDLEKHLFYQPALNFPSDFDEKTQADLSEAYQKMVLNAIVPAYEKLHDFMANEYDQFARESSGFNDLKRGEEYYQHAIKRYTTTTMTADEIHELGLNEVARIKGEMKQVMKEVGFEGDLKAFFEYVRNKKELMPFTDADEVIANFYSIQEKMLPQVNKLFGVQPKTPFEVRRTEAFREASASAEYNPGSLDGTRPGIFYVPIPEVTRYNMYSDEDLFLHEAIPGHHFQISLQQENTTLPSFRKDLWYSAYGEGWALYTESLGKELGLYDDPYQYFGMLGAEMHRAIRLVVDTGLHAKGWTREQAIQYSLDNEAESEASIISEIERYMANPAQALSYKIGQLKILELRAKAEAAFGATFDIKEFHKIVLESGCIPLDYLEEKIDKWIQNSSK
ncbi:MAG: DUF885 domain-containing protein [Flavobacteriaceae bacterium]|nr:DUF885 domain-containing protein [Flavobacteriaceae bacterium]